VQFYYTATILLFLVVTSILSLFAPPIGVDCIRSTYWHWWCLIGLEAVETFLMLVLAVITWNLKRKQENHHPYYNEDKLMIQSMNSMLSNTSNMLESDSNIKRFELQVLIMTIFYIFSFALDIIIFELHQHFEGDDFECYRSKYIVVLTNRGASYFLVYNLISFSYTLIMIYTFYYLLKRSGMTI